MTVVADAHSSPPLVAGDVKNVVARKLPLQDPSSVDVVMQFAHVSTFSVERLHEEPPFNASCVANFVVL
jgi:hypothetical protein